LGTNDFRYERSGGGGNIDSGGGSDAHYDGLLDDIHFMSSGIQGRGMGEYYGDSHYAASMEEEDLADATLLSAASAASALSAGMNQRRNEQQQHQKNISDEAAEDWMSIDIKALDKCLKQIPIHERLKLPYHIGMHLENMYGLDTGVGGGRKKTLAELREEAKCVIVDNGMPDPVVSSGESESAKEKAAKEIIPGQNDKSESDIQRDKVGGDNNDDPNAAEDDNDGEDLEAWLDDMIS